MPDVSVQPGICSLSGSLSLSLSLTLGVSLGEQSTAPAWAARGETPAPRQGPGHRAPAQPAAREAEAGAYGAEWRGGASSAAGSPWTSASAGAPVGPAGCGGHIPPPPPRKTPPQPLLSLFKGCSLLAGGQRCFTAPRTEARIEGTLSPPPESACGSSEP
ncbi:hypothetical protein EI555_000005, partial [Monodon monoceros]